MTSLPTAAATALREATRVTVLTGAGISAESGIPTFRDALTGLWANFRAEDLATPEAFQRNPRLVWDWYAERRRRVLEAEPNAGHFALATLEGRVPTFALFTQNVDGLHRRAGSRQVLELHGSLLNVKCFDCGAPAFAWDEAAHPPRCAECGGFLRPDVVWFGEALPEPILDAAWEAAATCDVFLSIGTSNAVQPAASLPWHAAAHGATVIVVNPTSDGQERGARIHHVLGAAGTVLPALLALRPATQ